ncbi:MAG: nicotinate-nucleotide--dimethylbenzimidazole phosphoribosyltransferase [Veillonella sp.]|nr:nicotinate-nucleotide--dimethylbenzimidazole phosphoribosyltransferase [Veillonella sp.]
MKDKLVLPIEEQLNRFLQPKCLIPGGLGLWEDYFRKICTAWGEINGEIRPQHIIFSADNGCNMEGYVGYNYEVTQKQSRNMLLGRSSATQFCNFNNIPYEVVDVGIASDDGIGVDCKVEKGTKNILNHPAMTEDEFNSAFQAGYERVEHYVKKGINLFSFGEMGLGNTTTSACVLSALTGADPTETVGPGSWPDKPDLMKRKIDFVRAVLDKHKASIVSDSEAERVRKIVAHVGGFDIAAILGAAACAVHMNDCVKDYALPSHNSREKGTELALAEVDITQDMVPIQAHMSMGEGTGAILMVQMLKTTQHMFVNVGTFADLMKL